MPPAVVASGDERFGSGDRAAGGLAPGRRAGRQRRRQQGLVPAAQPAVRRGDRGRGRAQRRHFHHVRDGARNARLRPRRPDPGGLPGQARRGQDQPRDGRGQGRHRRAARPGRHVRRGDALRRPAAHHGGGDRRGRAALPGARRGPLRAALARSGAGAQRRQGLEQRARRRARHDGGPGLREGRRPHRAPVPQARRRARRETVSLELGKLVDAGRLRLDGRAVVLPHEENR
jgi:hypothetical protein